MNADDATCQTTCQNKSGASKNKLLFNTKVDYKDNNTNEGKL